MYQGKNFFLHTVCFLVHTIHRFNYSCIRLATQIWWPLFLLVDTRPEKLLGRNGKCTWIMGHVELRKWVEKKVHWTTKFSSH